MTNPLGSYTDRFRPSRPRDGHDMKVRVAAMLRGLRREIEDEKKQGREKKQNHTASGSH